MKLPLAALLVLLFISPAPASETRWSLILPPVVSGQDAAGEPRLQVDRHAPPSQWRGENSFVPLEGCLRWRDLQTEENQGAADELRRGLSALSSGAFALRQIAADNKEVEAAAFVRARCVASTTPWLAPPVLKHSRAGATVQPTNRGGEFGYPSSVAQK